MRFEKTNGEEEWSVPFCQLVQFLPGQAGCQSVGIALILHVGTLVRLHMTLKGIAVGTVGIAEKGIPAGTPLPCIEQHLVPAMGQFPGSPSGRSVIGIEKAVSVVADLADAYRIIAVPPQPRYEGLRRLPFRSLCDQTTTGVIGESCPGTGQQTCQQTVPRGATGGHRNKFIAEQDPLSGQPVHVRRLQKGVAITPQLRAQIIHEQEQYIGTLFLLPGPVTCRKHGQEEEQQ